MNNLPLSGSQYWGAGLNNYLRQLTADIKSIQSQLNNVTSTASFSGSGLANSTYSLFPTSSAEAGTVEISTGVYEVTNNSEFIIEGTFIFNDIGTGQITPTTVKADEEVKMTFSRGKPSGTLRPIDILEYNDVTDTYDYKSRDKVMTETLLHHGFYPVYAIKDTVTKGCGFKIAANIEQSFIFNDDYILIGLIEVTKNDASSLPSLTFIKKCDSAFKNIYDTRKGNLESYATIVNDAADTARGLFEYNEDGNLVVKLLGCDIDYHANGINGNTIRDESSETNNDIKILYDYKRFSPGEGKKQRRCYDVVTTTNSESLIEEQLIKHTIGNWVITSTSPEFNKKVMYGFYIAASGDILVEPSGEYPSELDFNYTWDLGADSNFRTAGLVLLGAIYYDSVTTTWKYLQPTANSISPTFITNKSVENTSYVRWPDVQYLVSSGEKIIPYTFDVEVPMDQAPSTTQALTDSDASTILAVNKLRLNTKFISQDDTAKERKYEIPVFPEKLYEPQVSPEGNFTAACFGCLTINVPGSETGQVEIASSGAVKIEKGLKVGDVSTNDSFVNIIKDLRIEGKLDASLDEALTLNQGINGITQMTTASGFLFSTPKNLYLQNATEDFVCNIVKESKEAKNNFILNTIDFTANAANITLNSDNPIVCNNGIKCKGDIEFTSDRRCKTNINSLDGEACLRAVKALDAKTFTYKDNHHQSLGLIAQEIEQCLPEYKDLLVSTQNADGLTDKRMVAEIKLNFILWQAVRELIHKLEER